MKTLKQLIVLTGLIALFVNIPANAFDGAILKGIEIDSPDAHSYRIIIKTDKDVPIKKYITDANKVVLDLENIRPAEFVKTLYNNATEVDHVIVQPFSGNNLRIFLQGLNIAAGKIILDTRDETLGFMTRPMPTVISRPQEIIPEIIPEKIIAEKPETSSSGPIFIDLSDRSVDKVKSVTPMVSYSEASKNNFKNVQNSMTPSYSTGNIFEASLFDWILRFLMLAVIIITGIKFFTKPKNVEISLSSEKTRSREMDLLKAAESKKELLTKSLGINSAARKPINTATSQYGLREYQNSQLPPRRVATSIPERNEKPLLRQPKTTAQSAKPAQNNLKQPGTTKVAQKQVQQAQDNFDGTRFLETMANIYQKSGRSDLASGIRQNLIKKQVG